MPRTRIIRAADCEHCGARLAWSGRGGLLDELEERRGTWRIWGYGLVAAGSFFAGSVPLLQLGVQLAALFILHVVLLRRGLLWLSPGRRILARLTIKLLAAAVACSTLLINVAVAPLVGLSAAILAFVGPLMTAVYVEGGLAIVRQRLRWEAEGRPLAFIEWGLPLGLAAAMLTAVAATAAVVVGTLHLLAVAKIPTISEIAAWLLELGQ